MSITDITKAGAGKKQAQDKNASTKKRKVEQAASGDDVHAQEAPVKKSKPTVSSVVASAVLDPATYRADKEITVKGIENPGLYQTFEDTAEVFPAALQKALKAAGFAAPTPIQAQAWPLAMTGRDLLAVAKTGSGKTCGFLLPSIARFLQQPAAAPTQNQSKAKGQPAILVMSPTRELALQIQEQAAVFGRAAGLRSAAVYGGAPKGPQIRDLHSGAQIVIATPGRLNDLLMFKCQDGSEVLTLRNASILVLDEADRMCDMGFEDDIRKIVSKMPTTKQTLFFTATWPKAVARVASTILRNPVHISIGAVDQLRANKDITQVVQVCHKKDKYDMLLALVKAEVTPTSRAIIFCNKKYLCDEIESGLWEAGFNVAAIHGDKTQQEREWALGQIRAGKMPLLVATDVAARGLDIKGMDRVINYDFPNNTEDYIHRIGRTGRAGASGIANTFFTADDDGKHAGELVKVLREAKQEVPAALEALVQHRGGSGGGGKWGGNKWGGNKWGGNKWGGQKGGGGNKWGKKY